jgi:ribosomal protein L31E
MTATQSADARYTADLTVEHFSSPRRAKRHVNMIQQYVGKYTTNVRTL